MNKKLFLAMIVILSIVLAACAQPTPTPTPKPAPTQAAQPTKPAATAVPPTAAPTAKPASTKPIKIGMSVGVTGPATYMYVNEVKQVRMAIDEVNKAGGVLGRQLELVLVDDAHDPKQAVVAAQSLCDMADIVAVLGHGSSGCIIPAAPVYHDAGMPVITHGSSPQVTELKLDNIFQNGANDAFHGIAMANMADKLGVKSVSIVFEKTMWGERLALEFRRRAEELKMKVLSYQGVDPKDVDFTPILTKIKGENPAMVFTAFGAAANAKFRKQKVAVGLTNVVDMGGELVGAEYLSTVGEAGVGAYSSVGSPVLDLNDDLKAMSKKFEELNGQKVEPFGIKFYEGVYILADAIKRAGTADRPSILKALKTTDMTGPITHWHLGFDQWGRMKYPATYIFKMNKPGTVDLVQEITGTYPPQE